MSVAALYDIHGNLPALEAVLDEIGRRQPAVDRLIVGGDVMPGPMVRECLDRLRNLGLPVHFIHGNGESAVLAMRRGGSVDALPPQARIIVPWVAGQLGPDDEEELARWPMIARLSIPAIGDVVFCHATPRNDTEIFTRLTPDERLLPVFEPVSAPTIVCGHTHMQFDRTIGSRRVVNAGSVGMPFGEPGAYWLLIGPDVELRRTEYDFEAAARRIRSTSYPQAAQFADGNVLKPPSEAEMLQAFTAVGL